MWRKNIICVNLSSKKMQITQKRGTSNETDFKALIFYRLYVTANSNITVSHRLCTILVLPTI